MLVSDFEFDLPESLIAKYPTPERSACRLMILDGNSGKTQQGHFKDVLNLINPGDLLVFNNTRVIPARAFGQKETGGKIEILLERITGEQSALVHMKSSKSPKAGARIILDQGYTATVMGREGELFLLQFEGDTPALSVFNAIGHMPLPPYIDRPDEHADRELYQTVYSSRPGAVAAPTAGLHFDEPLLDALKAKGVNLAFLTLHVGAGTFQNIRVDKVEEHHMHSEYAEVPQSVIDQITATRAAGKRVIAVGTTSVRSLETVAQKTIAQNLPLAPFVGDTNIFIYPGYQYQLVDALITNFHLPGSTLIMLVSALAGKDHIMKAYHEAVESQFRFFSYGDAMFITKQTLNQA